MALFGKGERKKERRREKKGGKKRGEKNKFKDDTKSLNELKTEKQSMHKLEESC